MSDCSSWHSATYRRLAIEHPANSIVGDRDARRVRPARAVHSPARMRARRREIEAADRRLRTTQAGNGPKHELLVQLRRSRTDRATGEVGIARLEIGGSHHVATAHARAESRREALD